MVDHTAAASLEMDVSFVYPGTGGFPLTFPFTLGDAPEHTLAASASSDLAVTATVTPEASYSGLLDAVVEGTAAVDSTGTRSCFADSSLEQTATVTADTLFAALLDAVLVIDSSRTGDSDRNAVVDADLPVTVSLIVEVGQGQNLDAELTVTATLDADSLRNAVVDASATIDATAAAAAQADFLIDPDLAVTADPTAASTRNQFTDADLSVTGTPEAEANSQVIVQTDLAVDTTVTTDIEGDFADESTGGAITVTLEASMDRQVYADAALDGTADFTADSTRNQYADASLEVESQSPPDILLYVAWVADTITLEAFVTVTEPEPSRGQSVTSELPIQAGAGPFDISHGQPFDVDLPVSADAAGTMSQGQNLDADLTGTATGSGTAIRNQFADADLSVTATVAFPAANADVLADAALEVMTSRDGTIIRNHNADADLAVTGSFDAAAQADFLIDPDLPVIASTDTDFLRVANVDADLAVTATTVGLLNILGLVETHLFLTAEQSAEVSHGQPFNTDLSVTAESDSTATRNQFADADLGLSAPADVECIRNQFCNSDLSALADASAEVIWYAGFDAALLVAVALPPSDFIKDMKLDGLLEVLTQTSEGLRQDSFTDSGVLVTADPATPNATRNVFATAADSFIYATTNEQMMLDGLTDATLVVPVGVNGNVSEILSSNFFPFYL